MGRIGETKDFSRFSRNTGNEQLGETHMLTWLALVFRQPLLFPIPESRHSTSSHSRKDRERFRGNGTKKKTTKKTTSAVFVCETEAEPSGSFNEQNGNLSLLESRRSFLTRFPTINFRVSPSRRLKNCFAGLITVWKRALATIMLTRFGPCEALSTSTKGAWQRPLVAVVVTTTRRRTLE